MCGPCHSEDQWLRSIIIRLKPRKPQSCSGRVCESRIEIHWLTFIRKLTGRRGLASGAVSVSPSPVEVPPCRRYSLIKWSWTHDMCVDLNEWLPTTVQNRKDSQRFRVQAIDNNQLSFSLWGCPTVAQVWKLGLEQHVISETTAVIYSHLPEAGCCYKCEV